jgi:hypothetical protein
VGGFEPWYSWTSVDALADTPANGETMLTAVTIVCLAALVPQENPPILGVGETMDDEVADGDPQIHTPTLDRAPPDAPAIGKSYLIEVDESGPYTIELRSYFFDAYLVLRDESGEILCEDDDGGVGSQATIATNLEVGAICQLGACALYGGRGAFELTLEKGRLRTLSPEQERAAERSELEWTIAVREEVLGSEHPDTATSLHDLAALLRARGDYAAALPRARPRDPREGARPRASPHG